MGKSNGVHTEHGGLVEIYLSLTKEDVYGSPQLIFNLEMIRVYGFPASDVSVGGHHCLV